MMGDQLMDLSLNFKELPSPSFTSSLETPNSNTPTEPIPKKSQQIKTDKPRTHVCTICTRAFARLEHLKRHERSHTNEKPFQCAACGRCFARRDLVLRHQQKLHINLPNIMRRNSKDNETPNLNNEHVIVLHNNTRAKAPLPTDGVSSSSAPGSGGSMTSAPGSGGSVTSTASDKPKARHSLSSASSNTALNDSNKNLFPRHNSFSAVSSNYVQSKDAQFNIIREEEAAANTDFSSPQLHNLDMNLDWNGMDHLDMYQQSQIHTPSNELFKKDFLDHKVNFFHQFGNPKHPHHLKGTTPVHSPQHIDSVSGPASAASHDTVGHMSEQERPSKRRSVDSTSESNKQHKSHSSFDQSRLLGDFHLANTPASNSQPNSVPNSLPFGGDSISDHGDWLQDIINTPYEPNFYQSEDYQNNLNPQSQDHLGQQLNNGEFPFFQSNQHTPGDEITSLFKSRQVDLSKHFEEHDHHPLTQIPQPSDGIAHPVESFKEAEDPHSTFHLDQPHLDSTTNTNNDVNKDIFDSYVVKKEVYKKNIFNEEIRDKIMIMSNLSDYQFPKVEELNSYMALYEREFNKYFPFVHLASLRNPMVDKFDYIPLLLAMASIGALYSYNDATTLLLFNLSKYHIQNFFEKEVTLDNLQFKKVPLMAHQCLVLHIFISMFLSEPVMTEITSRQMKSMVGLIKSTNFHKPLEKFLIPPKSITNTSEEIPTEGESGSDDTNSKGEASDHNSLAQRNFDYFIMAQSRIRTMFVFYMLQQFRTSSILDLSILINASSVTCGNYCINEDLWRCENSETWMKELKKQKITQDIIELSNNGNLKSNITKLDNYEVMDLNMNNLLSLLMYVHEKIQEQFNKLRQNRIFIKFDHINWRLNNSNLLNLIKSWEMNFFRNGGVLVINESNSHLLDECHELKLILPLYHLAKIKIAVNLPPIIERITYKDWDKMNDYLDNLHLDFEGLKESIGYSLDIMNLWNQNILVVNNTTENNLRTPVFFVTCVFVSLLLISQFLYYIEQINDKDHGIGLGITEKILWLKCERILKNCEKIISLNYSSNLLDFENYESIRNLIETNSDSKLIVNSLKLIKLSNKCLFLGVRILADAPIWPLAMGFAEALKNRANYI